MKIMKTREQEIEIYRAYMETKGDDSYTVNDVCKQMNIAKGNLYIIIDRVENGNNIQLKRCINQNKISCTWKYRYQQRALIIEDYSGRKYSTLLRQIIIDMRKDDFGVREIGRLLCKSPTLINYYLK